MKDLVKRSSIFFAGQGTSKIVTAGIYIWIARLLTPSDYGKVVFFVLLLVINQVVFDLGLGQWYQKHVTDETRNELFQTYVQLRMSLAILGTALFSVYLFAKNYDALFIALYGLASFMDALASTAHSYYLETKRPSAPSIYILFKGIGIGFMMYLFLQHVTIYQGFIGYIIAGTIWLFIWFPDKSIPKVRLSFTRSRHILSQSIHFAYLQITSFAYARADSIIIESTLGTTALGFYGTAYRYLEMAAMFPNAIAQNLFHISAKEHISKKDLTKLTGFSAALGVATSMAVFLGSHFLIVGLLGAKYGEAVPVMQILSFVVFLFFLNAPLATFVQSSELLKKFLPFGIGNTLLNIALNIVFIPLYGIQAAAWMMIVSESLGTVINLYFVREIYKDRTEISN